MNSKTLATLAVLALTTALADTGCVAQPDDADEITDAQEELVNVADNQATEKTGEADQAFFWGGFGRWGGFGWGGWGGWGGFGWGGFGGCGFGGWGGFGGCGFGGWGGFGGCGFGGWGGFGGCGGCF
ncbi:MAG: hypothetical protein QM820_37200 [Minicystis sp.]